MKATHKRGDGPYFDPGDQWNLYTGWDIFPVSQIFPLFHFILIKSLGSFCVL